MVVSSPHEIIRAQNVRKTFGDDGVLTNVDLVVEKGEILALMGKNGVGKSVLLSCLAGSEPLSSGRIEVCGVAQAGREGVAGFLLQEAMCIDRLTGRETIAFYDRLHPRSTNAWREYTDQLDLDDLDKRVDTYSGGMKRKLELVITLSIDVPVYFLDEPTAGLDLSAIQAVHAILREQRAAGKTIVVASHLPMDAGLADRIAFLQGGTIVATNTPTALLSELPPVITTASTDTADALTEHVLGGELFSDGGTVRGFVRPSLVSTVTDDSDVRTTEPTYTDVFNYYTNLSQESY